MKIIQSLIKCKSENIYSILGVTNHDLYPNHKTSFVFGLSNITDRAGVASLKRLSVEFDSTGEAQGAPPELHEKILLHRACNLMVHEIAHQFGLHHCIYYECTMNGTNGLFESDRKPDATLCPSCLIKL